MLVGPIITLYLIRKGLDFTQIMTLQAIFSVSIFIFEVPTGAFGDLVGRKTSLFLAGLFMMGGSITYMLGKVFPIFILGEVLFAIGLSLKSGSDTAIVHDTLKELGKLDQFTKILGRGESYFLASQIVASIISGWIYAINPELPLLLSAIIMLLSAFSALFMVEIKTYEHEEKPSYFNQIKESGVYLKNNRRIIPIVVYSVFFFVFYKIGFWYYQPYLKSIDIDIKYFGIIVEIFNIVATIFARYSDLFIKRTKGKSMILLSILLTTSFLLMGIFKTKIGFLFICLQQITRGVNMPIFMKYINKHIPSNKRATIISFNSLVKNLAAAAIMPFAGYVMDHMDIINVNLYTGVIMLIGTVFFYFYLNSRLKKTEDVC